MPDGFKRVRHHEVQRAQDDIAHANKFDAHANAVVRRLALDVKHHAVNTLHRYRDADHHEARVQKLRPPVVPPPPPKAQFTEVIGDELERIANELAPTEDLESQDITKEVFASEEIHNA